MAEKGNDWKRITTGVFAAVLGLALCIIAVKIDCRPAEYPITFLVLITGCILGWLTGFIVSPYTKDEEAKFSNYAKIVAAFASGYLLNVFKKVVDDFANDWLINDRLTMLRFILFVCSFSLTLIVVYVFRSYANGSNENKNPNEPIGEDKTKISVTNS